MILKVSTMTSHAIVNKRDQSASEPLFAIKLNANVMFNITSL
jgi:hypothetical protein